MNQRVALRPATAMNQSADPRVLGTIVMPGVAVAIWHRSVAPDMRAWLDTLPVARLPRLRQVLGPAMRARFLRRPAIVPACRKGHNGRRWYPTSRNWSIWRPCICSP